MFALNKKDNQQVQKNENLVLQRRTSIRLTLPATPETVPRITAGTIIMNGSAYTFVDTSAAVDRAINFRAAQDGEEQAATDDAE